MKHHLIISSILLTLTLIFFSKVNAQEPMTPCPLHLQTDKTIYVSGESIAFKCVLSPANEGNSSTLFVDICGENYLLSSYILKKENGQWNGEVSIPDSVQTGVYLLRAYLGNKQGIPIITSQLISILNRFGENQKNEERKKKTDYFPLSQMDYLATSGKLLQTYAKTNQCTRGETLQFWIENDLPNYVGGISFSVFKIEGQEQIEINIPTDYIAYKPSNDIKIYEQYTVRGIVRNKQNNEPATNETVYFSIPDSIAQIKYDFTNNEGIFRFMLNDYTTNENIIIQTKDKNTLYDIQLYPSQLLPPEKIPFYLPSEVMNSELAQLAIQRATLHMAYFEEKLKKLPEIKDRYPFYSIAKNRVLPGKYVDLVNFKEIAWEILPLVKYRQTKDSITLKLFDPELNIFYNNPMILVDGVPISSPASLNMLNSKMIKWIDMQPQIRCYGNLFFEGLLNIQTYKGDFSILELPVNAIRTELDKYYYPDKKEQEKPIFRDVLYWDPYLGSSKKVDQINVMCSQEKGIYIAIAQAFDTNGKCVRSVFQFEVNDK